MEEALAPDSARSDRDLRLGDVIAGAQGIALGVEEDVDALPLVAVEHAVGDRRGDRDRGRGNEEDPGRQAGEEHHRHPAQHDHDAGAEVGLDEDQEGRHPEQDERRPDRARLADLADRNELVEAGEGEDDRRLHELRRLQADRAEVEPALRPLADEAERLHADEHDEGQPVNRKGEGLDRPLAQPRHGDGHAEEEQEDDALLHRPGLGRSAGRRIKHDQAEHGDPGDEEDQAPRQPRQRPRNDGRADHALLAVWDSALKASSWRALRSASVPPHCFSNGSRASNAFRRSNK